MYNLIEVRHRKKHHCKGTVMYFKYTQCVERKEILTSGRISRADIIRV